MIVPHLGRHRLEELKPVHLREWLAVLRRTPSSRGTLYSTRTVQLAHAVLRRALNDAVRDELLPRNVALLVRAGKVVSPPVTPLRPEELAALLVAAPDDRLYALWLLLVAVGLRRGEALGLHWDDIDLDARTLAVRRSLQRRRTAELTPSGRRRGHLVEVEARLLHTGRTSMHIGVHVRSGDPATGEMELTTYCRTVFVTIDKARKAEPVTPWLPVTDEDRALDAHALELSAIRARHGN